MSFLPGEKRSELDNLPRDTLKGRMIPIAPDKEQTRRALARQRARVQARLAALWRQAQALADAIEEATAAGQSHQRQSLELAALRRRSTHLAELGATLDLQRSESESIAHGRPARRWRPTAAQPF